MLCSAVLKKHLIKMLLNKKADLSIQLIVVIVIALVIMVVILAITTGKLKIFGSTAASCAARGGEMPCRTSQCSSGSVNIPGTECEPDKYCCQKIFEEDPLKPKTATSGIDFEDKAGSAAERDRV